MTGAADLEEPLALPTAPHLADLEEAPPVPEPAGLARDDLRAPVEAADEDQEGPQAQVLNDSPVEAVDVALEGPEGEDLRPEGVIQAEADFLAEEGPPAAAPLPSPKLPPGAHY